MTIDPLFPHGALFSDRQVCRVCKGRGEYFHAVDNKTYPCAACGPKPISQALLAALKAIAPPSADGDYLVPPGLVDDLLAFLRPTKVRVSHTPPWHACWLFMTADFLEGRQGWLAPGHKIRATRPHDVIGPQSHLVDVVIDGPLMPEVFQGEECQRVDFICHMHNDEKRGGFWLEGVYCWRRDGEDYERSWEIGRWKSIDDYRAEMGLDYA